MSMAKDLLKDRVESEAKAFIGTTNNDLKCKDCLLRYDDSVKFGNTSKCEVYPRKKPNDILLGRECDKYVKE